MLGFDYVNESKEEKHIKAQIEAHFGKNKKQYISVKEKSTKTKCSDNPFVSEDPDDSEENWSIDSEGGVNSIHMYFKSKHILSKHKSFTDREPMKLDCKPIKRSNQKIKLLKQDYDKISESWISRNIYEENAD